MTKVAYYAFYGSLRQGMYNHERFKSHLDYQFSEPVAGFTLHALARYPVAVRSNSENDRIVVEVFKIKDGETENKIHQIEIDAGYYFEEIKVRGISARIYLFHDPAHYPIVPDGDWVKYVQNKKYP